MVEETFIAVYAMLTERQNLAAAHSGIVLSVVSPTFAGYGALLTYIIFGAEVDLRRSKDDSTADAD